MNSHKRGRESEADWCLCRVRQLRLDPYSQKEAEAAVGLSTDNGAAARLESALPFDKLQVACVGVMDGGDGQRESV